MSAADFVSLSCPKLGLIVCPEFLKQFRAIRIYVKVNPFLISGFFDKACSVNFDSYFISAI
jgi:hypothetical protein